MTNKERLEAIKANWADALEASEGSPHFEGPWLDDDDMLWLIQRAERCEELERKVAVIEAFRGPEWSEAKAEAQRWLRI